MQKPRNIVGPVVRELREKKGLTQPQLVAKLNLAGWDVSRETLWLPPSASMAQTFYAGPQ
ncbi:MAG: hypothetical protein NT154_17290 [Verrucomicrobia bacterium]|nr:hypothetical protein [Verrucomicrobiota bacterium]